MCVLCRCEFLFAPFAYCNKTHLSGKFIVQLLNSLLVLLCNEVVETRNGYKETQSFYITQSPHILQIRYTASIMLICLILMFLFVCDTFKNDKQIFQRIQIKFLITCIERSMQKYAKYVILQIFCYKIRYQFCHYPRAFTYLSLLRVMIGPRYQIHQNVWVNIYIPNTQYIVYQSSKSD